MSKLLHELLDGTLKLTIVHTARDAIAVAEHQHFDAACIDLGLPDMDGVELISMLSARWPELPTIVLTVATQDARILAAIRAGACGYLFKEDAGARLVSAIDDALAGGAPMSRGVAKLVLQRARSADDGAIATHLSELSQRERDVLALLAQGQSYEEVAGALGLSINTVRTHIRSLYVKLAVTSKGDAVLAATRLGILRR